MLDATHLEHNLDLAYQLKEYPIPIVYSLNLIDVAERQGISIDAVDKKEVTFIEVLEDKTIQPWPGIPLALLVLILSLGIVVGGGKALRALILLPLVKDVIHPVLTNIVSQFVSPGTFRNLLVGEFGIRIIGIEWPFALILPYVFLFYIVFSILEDCGYLPRIGVLADGVFRRMGIQGGNIISIMLGYGCAVPAIQYCLYWSSIYLLRKP